MTAPESASRDRAPSPAKLAIEVLAGAIVLLVLWRLRNVALLCFAAIIFAALLRGLADPLTRKTRLRSRWAILIVIVVLASSFTIAMWRSCRSFATPCRAPGRRRCIGCKASRSARRS